MSAKWRFNKFQPGGRQREPQVKKFFNAEGDRANPIIREGIQNSLDATQPGKILRLRLRIDQWSANERESRWQTYSDALNVHLDAMRMRSELPDAPEENETFRFLVFEDFETNGLLGKPEQWRFLSEKNPFFDFFRGEGLSHKEGDARGRHGVGKTVFMGASRIQAIFGLTRRRDDGRELLMGTTVLGHHDIDQTAYLPDGWFGIEDPDTPDNVLPVEDAEFIKRFKSDFRISRVDEPGLSVVVPWLDKEIKAEELIKSVIEGYFLPLVRNTLVVEIYEGDQLCERIDHQSIQAVINRRGEQYSQLLAGRMELAIAASHALATSDRPGALKLSSPAKNGAPKWEETCIPDSSLKAIREALKVSEIIHLECPVRIKTKKSDKTLEGMFHIFMRRDSSPSSPEIYFVRQGILVSGMKPRISSGMRALVIIEDKALGKFLGDAENPAHTEWLSEFVRGAYSYHKASIEYVVESVQKILALAREEDAKPDPTVMMDLFFERDPEPTELKSSQKKKPDKKAKETEAPSDLPAPKPKSYKLTKTEGGFKLSAGDPGAPTPVAFEILMAYDTNKGDPFRKYHPADFRLDEASGITAEYLGLEIRDYSLNRIYAEVTAEKFELDVSGFDLNRDLIVSVRSKGVTMNDTESEDEDKEAENAAQV